MAVNAREQRGLEIEARSKIERRGDFLSHYHVQSNAESTFSSMKRVFGKTLRSRTPEAQTNELLFEGDRPQRGVRGSLDL